MSDNWIVKKAIEELQRAVYEGHRIKEELANDKIELSPSVEAELDGKMSGYGEAIDILKSYLDTPTGGEGQHYARFQ